MYLVVLTLLVIKVLEKKKNDVSVRSYLSLLRTFCYSSRLMLQDQINICIATIHVRRSGLDRLITTAVILETLL